MELKKENIILIDKTSEPGIIYLGKASPGSQKNQASWLIKKINKAEVSVLCAEGSREWNKKWDDRLALQYR